MVGASGKAYAFVFGLEAAGFFVAHLLALNTSFSGQASRKAAELPRAAVLVGEELSGRST